MKRPIHPIHVLSVSLATTSPTPVRVLRNSILLLRVFACAPDSLQRRNPLAPLFRTGDSRPTILPSFSPSGLPLACRIFVAHLAQPIRVMAVLSRATAGLLPPAVHTQLTNFYRLLCSMRPCL